MNNQKLKRVYTPPKMKIVEVKHQGSLMQYSGHIGLQEFEKDYRA
jgi:hypothetical protein